MKFIAVKVKLGLPLRSHQTQHPSYVICEEVPRRVHTTKRVQQTRLHVRVKCVYSREQTCLHNRANAFIAGDKSVQNAFVLYLAYD